MQPEIDYSALVDPVTRAELREHLASNPRPFEPPNPGLGVFAVIFLVACYAVGVPIIVGGTAFAYLGGALLFFGTAMAVGAFVMSRGALLGTVQSHYRYTNFARANGFTFAPLTDVRGYPATIFTIGGVQGATNLIQSTTGRRLDIGNVSSSATTCGYMALRLDRKLPHMILDSMANNGLLSTARGGERDLPGLISKNQRLSLEGDFDKHFTLYCPQQYERDALYIFTPDLMALLIDNAAPFDVEIVDDWMFVYSSRPFTASDHELYRRLFRITDTVGEKTLRQTARYSDERVGGSAANLIAAPGSRLKRKFTLEGAGVLVAVPVIGLIVLIAGMVADAVSR